MDRYLLITKELAKLGIHKIYHDHDEDGMLYITKKDKLQQAELAMAAISDDIIISYAEPNTVQCPEYQIVVYWNACHADDYKTVGFMLPLLREFALNEEFNGLMRACQCISMRVMKTLLEYGIDVNKICDTTYTALHYAVVTCDGNSIDALIEATNAVNRLHVLKYMGKAPQFKKARRRILYYLAMESVKDRLINLTTDRLTVGYRWIYLTW